jgi:hypothetical protein
MNTPEKYSAKCRWCKRVMNTENEIPVWTLEPRKAECMSCHEELVYLKRSAAQEFGINN